MIPSSFDTQHRTQEKDELSARARGRSRKMLWESKIR